MLEHITPVILTFNEEPNIARVLDKLTWATSVIVLDSFSSDKTEQIAKTFQNVQFFSRKFDCHANQWNAAIMEYGIQTPWILALDADYILTDAFIDELKNIPLNTSCDGFYSEFKYCIDGHALRASLYPPVLVLYRTGKGIYEQDGHTQRIKIASQNIGKLASYILHDDRKSLGHWLLSQYKYMTLEADLLNTRRFGELSIQDRLRCMIIVSPAIIAPYCLFYKGLVADGKYGLLYTMQRLTAELILSMRLLTIKLENKKSKY